MSAPNYSQYHGNQYAQQPYPAQQFRPHPQQPYPPQGYHPAPAYAAQPPPWSFSNVLFSFKGRINRGKWWAAVGITLAVEVAAIIIGLIVGATAGAYYAKLALIIMIFGLALPFLIFATWVALAAGVKRLHDCGKSGHWMWLLYGLPVIITIVGNMIAYGGPGNGLHNPHPAGLFISFLAFPIWIWNFVQIGCLRGTRGPNQYGPDPIPHIP